LSFAADRCGAPLLVSAPRRRRVVAAG